MKLPIVLCTCALICSAASCSSQTSDPNGPMEVTYFPADSISQFEQSWYSSHLLAMGEPVLVPDVDVDYFALRIILLPTWGHPLALRYEMRNGDAILRGVLLSGWGGYDPGEIREEITRVPTSVEMDDVISAFEESGYWRLPLKDDVVGFDGSQLIIETIRNGEHRVLVRWTPEHETEARGLAGLVEFYTGEFEKLGLWNLY